jgi:hypothetical protein
VFFGVRFEIPKKQKEKSRYSGNPGFEARGNSQIFVIIALTIYENPPTPALPLILKLFG